ncbi:unnamed protein product [Vitrella brassicaformis CCMP3155]|uniref:Uncharacterized protein n=2 Tax=Vitrella brassicaformis TaxID=1169539 RepID=A0A0G4ET84_VITBC|nr:unnamed protein product [Vitrella brassicaformis CCMP3155]|eukprot:CEM01803.1 unnamed protein product [Vitrella brassicaformis CCMP3155]
MSGPGGGRGRRRGQNAPQPTPNIVHEADRLLNGEYVPGSLRRSHRIARQANVRRATLDKTTIRLKKLSEEKLNLLKQMERGKPLSVEEKVELERLEAELVDPRWSNQDETWRKAFIDTGGFHAIKNEYLFCKDLFPRCALKLLQRLWDHLTRRDALHCLDLLGDEEGVVDWAPAPGGCGEIINEWVVECECMLVKVVRPGGWQPANGDGLMAGLVKQEPIEGQGADEGEQLDEGEFDEDRIMDGEEDDVAMADADADASPEAEDNLDEDTDQQDGALVADVGDGDGDGGAADDRIGQSPRLNAASAAAGSGAAGAADGAAPDSPMDVPIVSPKQEADTPMEHPDDHSTVRMVATIRDDIITHPSENEHLPTVKTETETDADGRVISTTTTPIPPLEECHSIAKAFYQQHMHKAFKQTGWRVAREMLRCLLSEDDFAYHAWRWARWCLKAGPGTGKPPDFCQLGVFRKVVVRFENGETQVWQLDGAEMVYSHSKKGVAELIDVTTQQDQVDLPAAHIKQEQEAGIEEEGEGDKDDRDHGEEGGGETGNDMDEEASPQAGVHGDPVADNTPPPPDNIPPADLGAPTSPSPAAPPAALRRHVRIRPITMDEWRDKHEPDIRQTFEEFCRGKASSSSNALGAYAVMRFTDKDIWHIEPQPIPGQLTGKDLVHPHVIRVTFAHNETKTLTDWMRKRSDEKTFERHFRLVFDRWFHRHKAAIMHGLGVNLLPRMPRDREMVARARAAAATAAGGHADTPAPGAAEVAARHDDTAEAEERRRKRKERRRLERAQREQAEGGAPANGVVPLVAVKIEPGVEQAASAAFTPVPIRQEPTDEHEYEPTHHPQPQAQRPFVPIPPPIPIPPPQPLVGDGLPPHVQPTPLPAGAASPAAAAADGSEPSPANSNRNNGTKRKKNFASGVSIKKTKKAKKKAAAGDGRGEGEGQGRGADIPANEAADAPPLPPINSNGWSIPPPPPPPLGLHHSYGQLQPPPPPYPPPPYAHSTADQYGYQPPPPPPLMPMPPHQPYQPPMSHNGPHMMDGDGEEDDDDFDKLWADGAKGQPHDEMTDAHMQHQHQHQHHHHHHQQQQESGAAASAAAAAGLEHKGEEESMVAEKQDTWQQQSAGQPGPQPSSKREEEGEIPEVPDHPPSHTGPTQGAPTTTATAKVTLRVLAEANSDPSSRSPPFDLVRLRGVLSNIERRSSDFGYIRKTGDHTPTAATLITTLSESTRRPEITVSMEGPIDKVAEKATSLLSTFERGVDEEAIPPVVLDAQAAKQENKRRGRMKGVHIMFETSREQLMCARLHLEQQTSNEVGGKGGFGKQYKDEVGRSIGHYQENPSGGFSWRGSASSLFVKLSADSLAAFNPSMVIGDGFDETMCVVRFYEAHGVLSVPRAATRPWEHVLCAGSHMDHRRIEVRYGLSNPKPANIKGGTMSHTCPTLFVRMEGRDLLPFLLESYPVGEGGGVVDVDIVKAHNWP